MTYFKYIGFILLFYSCVKDKPVKAPVQAVQLSNSKKVYVLNEGNYGSGNASVSLYDPATQQVVENFYHSVNGSTMGDVLQSMTFVNGKFYLVINNSGKISVCDESFKKTSEIVGLQSPRYLLPISNQKAYVSDLYANAIHVIDLNTNTKTTSIPCSGWTEQMLMIYNKVFVCNLRTNYVYVINAINNQKVDSVLVGLNASSLVLDKNDKVWVLAKGDKNKNNLPRLSCVDPVLMKVEKSFEFAPNDSPGNLCLNKTKDTLFYLNKHVFRIPITLNALPQQAFVDAGQRNFYGMGVNPNTYALYLADALDYTQRSNIYIYAQDGSERSVFKAGLIANGFYFE